MSSIDWLYVRIPLPFEADVHRDSFSTSMNSTHLLWNCIGRNHLQDVCPIWFGILIRIQLIFIPPTLMLSQLGRYFIKPQIFLLQSWCLLSFVIIIIIIMGNPHSHSGYLKNSTGEVLPDSNSIYLFIAEVPKAYYASHSKQQADENHGPQTTRSGLHPFNLVHAFG